ncbi:MAG: septum site-determining protein MinC [Anaerolineales bacterium]|jgi:septum site-determining protein MinC
MHAKVQIKGIREGLLVSLGEGEWPEIQQSLLEKIDNQGDFLRGAKMILNVENHILNAAVMGELRDELSEKGVSLWAVLSNSPTTEQTAQTLGLATRIHQAQYDADTRPVESNISGEEAILIRRTLRSGNSIEFSGHVIVIGDVNPGAEIIADGDIVVWGRLRGMVHAGADGDEKAIVCAMDLAPTQLRIADKIAIPPQERGQPKPEIAIVRGDQVVAESWDTSR